MKVRRGPIRHNHVGLLAERRDTQNLEQNLSRRNQTANELLRHQGRQNRSSGKWCANGALTSRRQRSVGTILTDFQAPTAPLASARGRGSDRDPLRAAASSFRCRQEFEQVGLRTVQQAFPDPYTVKEDHATNGKSRSTGFSRRATRSDFRPTAVLCMMNNLRENIAACSTRRDPDPTKMEEDRP